LCVSRVNPTCANTQRQSFDSNVIVDTGVFCTSTRSVISSSAVKGMLEAKGFTPGRALFIGASRSTCTEANGAGVGAVQVEN
jgi:hypothetical protein